MFNQSLHPVSEDYGLVGDVRLGDYNNPKTPDELRRILMELQSMERNGIDKIDVGWNRDYLLKQGAKRSIKPCQN